MLEFIFLSLDFLHKELLLFASLCFLIGSIDDTAFDSLWLVHAVKRRFFVYRKYRRATVETLPKVEPDAENRPLAVFVPAWQVASVIASMINRCREQWKNSNYRMYLGCYPNDNETIAAVCSAARGTDNVRLVICPRNGPTSKADCLNRLWQSLCEDEILESMNFKAVILQDAEDLVHPGALDLFDHLIDRASLVQLPVIPRRTVRARWVAGHYGDEFAELHGKQMVLREALGVSIPSAGVGCAFSKEALADLARHTDSRPFDAASLTEDYELGLRLTEGNARGIFARIKDRDGQLVATQEFFPDNLEDAIRQKSRWMAGIALSGWDRMGWNSCWRENWMRLRDRKASIAAIVLALAYCALVLTLSLFCLKFLGLYQPRPLPDFLKFMLLINGGFLAWRLALKGYFVFILYGWTEAAYSIPRTFVANIINILAARRALFDYAKSLSGSPMSWKKTRHFHPLDGEILHLKSSSFAQDD